jgi:acyl dehydratase
VLQYIINRRNKLQKRNTDAMLNLSASKNFLILFLNKANPFVRVYLFDFIKNMRYDYRQAAKKRSAFLMDILYFEDIEVGKKRTSLATYKVTKEEIIEFARRWDPRPFHLDETAAASSVFGGLVSCSAHIFSILSWFATQYERRTATLAAISFDELRIHTPVRPGDTLSCTFTCINKKESQSKKDRGIVRTVASLSNQQSLEVFSTIVTTMVEKTPR